MIEKALNFKVIGVCLWMILVLPSGCS